MAVDNSTAKLRTHQIELIAESRHLIGTVFIAGNNLVNGVDDNGNIVFLGCSANQFWCKFVHRYRLATQIPDIQISDILRAPAHGHVNVIEAVKAASTVKLKVNIKYLSLCAFPAQPFTPFRNGTAQLNQSV